MNPIEIPNVVDAAYQKQLRDFFYSKELKWNFIDKGVMPFSPDFKESLPLFQYSIYERNGDTDRLEFFKPLLDAILEKSGLKMTELLKVKAGFLLNTIYVLPSFMYKHNPPHKDFEEDHYTAIYYVIDSDGDSYVFNEKKESSSYTIKHRSPIDAGKALVFGGFYHASACPKLFSKRIAITFNFKAE